MNRPIWQLALNASTNWVVKSLDLWIKPHHDRNTHLWAWFWSWSGVYRYCWTSPMFYNSTRLSCHSHSSPLSAVHLVSHLNSKPCHMRIVNITYWNRHTPAQLAFGVGPVVKIENLGQNWIIGHVFADWFSVRIATLSTHYWRSEGRKTGFEFDLSRGTFNKGRAPSTILVNCWQSNLWCIDNCGWCCRLWQLIVIFFSQGVMNSNCLASLLENASPSALLLIHFALLGGTLHLFYKW